MAEEKRVKVKKIKLNIKTEGIKSASAEITNGLIELLTRRKIITDKNEAVKEFYRYEETIEKKHSAFTKNEKISFLCLGLVLFHIILLFCSYINAIGGLKEKVISNSVPYIALSCTLPFIGWLYATNENFWAFHKRKRLFFYLCAINLLLTLLQPVYSLGRSLGAGLISKIEVNQILTPAMVILLGQIITIVFVTICMVILHSQIEPLLTNESLKRQIDIFKLRQIKDDRVDKEYKYDLHIIKDLNDGSPITIKERDRFVQGEVNGASGTGKTSSIFTTAIEEDMNTKMQNREKRHEAFLQLIKEGKATLKGPIRIFNEDAVIAVGKTKAVLEKNEKELLKIKKKYPDAGITVVAPNASLNEDIIRLALARNITVNVLDPVNDYSHYTNVRMVGINPFYIPLGLEENERLIRISQASTMFAEVLIAANQRDGKSDQYFTDISLSVCSNIATIIMLANNIKGQQAYIEDIQECINNFNKLNTYVDIIEAHYDIHVEGKDTGKATRALTGDDIRNNERRASSKNARKNPYYLQILFVKQELLGAGAEDMFSQARGLRNLINKVIQDPRIRAKLGAEKENMLNFDELLSKNQITIVNTAIELGSNTSTAFGLFFILLHKISVLRRPMHTRTPHFLWIDEATQYMHPCYEDMIALYRQFMCAVVISLQSLTQTEKSNATAYLKDVFLGAGTHIVFGRLTPDEMKLYSQMGGMELSKEEQITQTANSIWTSSPSFSESVRSSRTLANIVEGSDMRMRDFQELTVFTIDNGRVLPGKLARVFFVKEDAYDKKVTRSILWEKAVPEAFREEVQQENEQDEPAKQHPEKKETLKAEMQIPKDQTQTLVTQKEVDAALEDKKQDYEGMSITELMELLYGADSMVNTESYSKKEGTTVWVEDTDEEILYRQQLEEFNRK